MSTPVLPAPFLAFDDSDVKTAKEAWGCESGHAALAAACGISLDELPFRMPSTRRHPFNSVVMKQCLDSLGFRWSFRDEFVGPGDAAASLPIHGLACIQIGGEWSSPDTPIRAARRWANLFRRWIACKRQHDVTWIYDIDAGWLEQATWEDRVVKPYHVGMLQSDGTWFPRQRFEVRKAGGFRGDDLEVCR